MVDDLPRLLAATARHKLEAALARRAPPVDAEPPAAAIDEACARIAAALAADDFAPRARGRRFVRRRGDLSEEIWVQADRNNIAGRRAAIWLHAGVGSRVVKRWRTAHPMPWMVPGYPASGLVAGGQIGNLREPARWLEWDVADPRHRDARADDAAAAIRSLALPFFDLVEAGEAGLAPLLRLDALFASMLIEAAWALHGAAAAETAARGYLRARPVIARRFDAALAAARRDGPVSHLGDAAAELAALSVVAGLDFAS